MKNKLPKPFKDAMIYEDKKLYVCLANYPIVKWHTVIVRKSPVTDLHLLSRKNYEYLMDKVDEMRTALLKICKIDKVYLIYMDEVNQVHWHLIPRYDEKGFNVFSHKASKIQDFTLAIKLKEYLLQK